MSLLFDFPTLFYKLKCSVIDFLIKSASFYQLKVLTLLQP